MKRLILVLLLIFSATSSGFSQFVLEYPNGELEIEGRIRAEYNKRFYFEGDNNFRKDRMFIGQARVKFEGKMFKDFGYEMTLEVRSYDAGSIAKDLYINYSPVPEFLVQFGQFKTPFSKQQLIAEEKLDLTNQCALTDEFVPGRDIGIMTNIETRDKKYSLRLGMFTGNAYNQKDDDSKGKPLFVGRIEASPFGTLMNSEGDLELSPKPLVMLGANFTHSDDNVNTADYPRTIVGKKFMYGGDITFKYKGLYLNAEFDHAQLMPDKAPNYKAGGYLVHASYFIRQLKLQPVIEYNDYNPSDLTVDDSQRTIVFGLNFLPKSNHSIKLMLNYFYHLKMKESDVNPWARNEIRFLTQLLIK